MTSVLVVLVPVNCPSCWVFTTGFFLGFLLHDRSLSFVAGDESRMAGGESRMDGGEPRMTGDCCRPEGSIHRCVRTHSHLYSYIYGLVALLDNIQSSFSKYHYLNIFIFLSVGLLSLWLPVVLWEMGQNCSNWYQVHGKLVLQSDI